MNQTLICEECGKPYEHDQYVAWCNDCGEKIEREMVERLIRTAVRSTTSYLWSGTDE